MEDSDLHLESMANALEETGRYRVLRRLRTRALIQQPDGAEVRLGLFIDVETTGLDPAKDEIIELAMVPFTYALDGRIFEIHEAFQSFREPSEPIPPAIEALTGITNEMVAGQTIDLSEVATFASSAALIIAHNAAFDRRFAERLSDVFIAKPWACSMTQIDWGNEGYEGTKLAYLTLGAGFFYDRHRAVNDCTAAIELLATSLPRSKVPAMRLLLQQARRPTWRIWADDAAFEQKDALKSRGYRWNGGINHRPRAWYIDVDDDDKEKEIQYLRDKIYSGAKDPTAKKITAYERFSDRC